MHRNALCHRLKIVYTLEHRIKSLGLLFTYLHGWVWLSCHQLWWTSYENITDEVFSKNSVWTPITSLWWAGHENMKNVSDVIVIGPQVSQPSVKAYPGCSLKLSHIWALLNEAELSGKWKSSMSANVVRWRIQVKTSSEKSFNPFWEIGLNFWGKKKKKVGLFNLKWHMKINLFQNPCQKFKSCLPDFIDFINWHFS